MWIRRWSPPENTGIVLTDTLNVHHTILFEIFSGRNQDHEFIATTTTTTKEEEEEEKKEQKRKEKSSAREY